MALEDAGNEVDVAITRKDPKGLAFENVFSGTPSFLRRKLTKDLSGIDLAITGIPFDQAVTNRPGARLGPRALREASSLMAGDPPFGWGFSPLDDFAIADYGDMAFDYARPSEVPERIVAHISSILETDTACLALGGDHSITYGALKAHAAKFGPVALLQFDAHTDTWVDDDLERVDHGTFVYKAANEGLIDPSRSVQVGIRVDNESPVAIERISASQVHGVDTSDIVKKIKEIIGDSNVYLSFDIDAFDPAFAPGTGTPVWAGLTSAQVAAILRGLAGINVVGGDVVEVSPPFDTASITAVAGAHVMYELISLWAWIRRQ